MSYYIEILSVQEPFDIGKDSQTRRMFSCNYSVRAQYPVSDFEREMVKLISDSGNGIFGTDIFIGRNAAIPSSDGPYTIVINTGGRSPDESHDTKYQNLSCQIVVVAMDYQLCQSRANAIWRELDGKRSITVSI